MKRKLHRLCNECGRLIVVHLDEEGNHKYSYENTVYKRVYDEVEIKCLKCGTVFMRLPSNHLKGSMCPNCAYMARFKTKDQFVTEAMSMEEHKDNNGDHKYDYENVVYEHDKKMLK